MAFILKKGDEVIETLSEGQRMNLIAHGYEEVQPAPAIKYFDGEVRALGPIEAVVEDHELLPDLFKGRKSKKQGE